MHDPLGWLDALGLSCKKLRRTKHTSNRHIDRKKYPGKSKFSKPSQVDTLIARTLKSPDNVISQGGRTRYEKTFGRVVGRADGVEQRGVVVIVDAAKNKIVTAFPF